MYQDPQTLHIQDVQHMKYSQVTKHLMLPEMSKAFLRKISHLLQEDQLWCIKETFQNVFKRIMLGTSIVKPNCS